MKELENKFVEKFRLDELVICRTDLWIISLRPFQVTIGSLILTLNRRCEYMSDLLPIESGDLVVAFKKIDFILGKTFKPDKINYLALMMLDSQVHFHVIPRYESPRKFIDNEYIDNNWPKPPILDHLEISETKLLELLNFMRRNAE